MKKIRDCVHELYWKYDINCARTMLICLEGLFDTKLEGQVLQSAIGLHGAGGYRAQCGLVEGALMFIGVYLSNKGKSDKEIASVCYEYAHQFTENFGSLKCYDLRPNGFTPNDPPHMCEDLTCRAVAFAYEFIKENSF